MITYLKNLRELRLFATCLELILEGYVLTAPFICLGVLFMLISPEETTVWSRFGSWLLRIAPVHPSLRSYLRQRLMWKKYEPEEDA